MKKIKLFLLLCFVGIYSFSQKPLTVEDEMPDWKFKPFINGTEEIVLSEFKGNVILLAFWVSSCSVCYDILPKMAELQNAFNDSFKIILVSDDNDTERARSKFEKRKHLKELGIPIMLKDNELLKLFPHDSDPHLIFIDAKGIIKGITGHESLTRQNIEKLIKGESVSFPGKSLQFSMDSNVPLITADIDNNSFLYSSLLTQEIPGLGPNFHFRNIGKNKFKLLVSNLDIIQLYRYAYSPLIRITSVDETTRLILKINDSIDYNKKYCYELILPQIDPRKRNVKALSYMQNDLDKFFKFDSRIEKQKSKCYVLTTNDSSGSMNDKEFYVQSWLSTTELNNAPLSVIAGEIKRLIKDLPVIIEGDQKKRFTMVLQKNYRDIHALRYDLQKHGILFEIKEREIDFLIIQNQTN